MFKSAGITFSFGFDVFPGFADVVGYQVDIKLFGVDVAANLALFMGTQFFSVCSWLLNPYHRY